MFFRAPIGLSEHIAQPRSPVGSLAHIPPQVRPFVEGNPGRIIRMNVLRKTETHPVQAAFRLKSSKQAIPHDQAARMVAVDAAGVRSMVHAMMRRCVENHFERTERTHYFGVNPELIEQTDGLHGEHHYRVKTNQWEPHPENPTCERACPTLAKSSGQVVALGGVMNDVGSPEKAAFVAGAMKPVIAEFVREEQQHPDPPLVAQIENPKAIDKPKDG